MAIGILGDNLSIYDFFNSQQHCSICSNTILTFKNFKHIWPMGLELTEAEKWQAAQPIRMQYLPDCMADGGFRLPIGYVHALLSAVTEKERLAKIVCRDFFFRLSEDF